MEVPAMFSARQSRLVRRVRSEIFGRSSFGWLPRQQATTKGLTGSNGRVVEIIQRGNTRVLSQDGFDAKTEKPIERTCLLTRM